MGFLLIVTGPPGAGKSTVAQLIVDGLEKGVLVPGDDFFGFLEGQLIAPWLPESHDQNEVVTEAAAAAAGRFATGGYATVYDGVVGAWSLDLFASATGLQSLHYVVLMPSIEQCLDRVANRIDHGFRDADATRHMYSDFANARVASRHVLRDPPDQPQDVADRILAAMTRDVLRYERRG